MSEAQPNQCISSLDLLCFLLSEVSLSGLESLFCIANRKIAQSRRPQNTIERQGNCARHVISRKQQDEVRATGHTLRTDTSTKTSRLPAAGTHIQTSTANRRPSIGIFGTLHIVTPLKTQFQTNYICLRCFTCLSVLLSSVQRPREGGEKEQEQGQVGTMETAITGFRGKCISTQVRCEN